MDSSRSSMQKNTCAAGLALELGQAAVTPMARQSAQNLAFVPAFIGQVEDAAALQPIARFHFAHERRPLRIGQPGYFIGGKRHHARGVIDAGRAAQTPFLLGLERALLGDRLSDAHARGHAGHGQPHGQEVHQRAWHGFMRSKAGIFFEPAHQSRPTGQRQQLGLKDVFPVGLVEIGSIEVVQHGIRCREGKVLLPAKLFVQARQISGEHAARLRQQRPDARIEALLAMRHGPIRHALIQKHRAQPDQPRMDDLVHWTRRTRALPRGRRYGQDRRRTRAAAPPGGNL